MKYEKSEETSKAFCGAANGKFNVKEYEVFKVVY